MNIKSYLRDEELSIDEIRDVLSEDKIISSIKQTHKDFEEQVLLRKNPSGVIVLYLESLHTTLRRLRKLPKSEVTNALIIELESMLKLGIKPSFIAENESLKAAQQLSLKHERQLLNQISLQKATISVLEEELRSCTCFL